MPWLVLLIVVLLPTMGVLSIPLLAIWTHHKRKMEELTQRRQQAQSEDVRAELAALCADLKNLRDTTMQYDLSFDTNLQHIDRRLGQLERQSRVSAPVDTGITQNLYNR